MFMVIVLRLKWCNRMQYCNQIKINSSNKLTTYTPIRSKDENKEIDWQSIVGLFLSNICNKDFNVDTVEGFKIRCQEAFESIFNDKNDWNLIEKIYFSSDDLFKISPDFLILKSKSRKLEQHNIRIAEMYFNLVENKVNLDFENAQVNFIEREINEILNQTKKNKYEKYVVTEEAYLPYLSDNFMNDLLFLSKHPKYFIASIEKFLKLYGFLYSGQLALNLYDIFSEPSNKELYFILETEKASGERSFIKNYGYSLFNRRLEKVFPLLSMNEQLQTQFDTILPFWKFSKKLEDNELNKNILKNFLEEFTKLKGFEFDSTINTNSSLREILGEISKIAVKQFNTDFQEVNQSRIDVNNRIVNAYVKKLCKDFIQYRGAAGATLVINFDFFLLLTNLCIGERDKLRLNELLTEMENRGVYFDKKSHAEIIKFYERVGNVERMSDSGDAIYVKKTI